MPARSQTLTQPSANRCPLFFQQRTQFSDSSRRVGFRARHRRNAYRSAVRVGLAALAQGSQGQRLRGFQKQRLVQRRQRLQRRVRARAAHAGRVAVRSVEGLQHRIRHGAIAEGVQRAAVAVLLCRFVPDLRTVARRRQEEKRRSRRIDARTADLRIQQTAGRERDIAHDFRIHAEARPARQQPVVRIAGVEVRRNAGKTAGRWRKSRSAGACVFRLQPRSMNSTASQSSSSGCDGGSLCVPRSSLVPTRPVPKYACHMRLTNERAVVGELRSTSQRANVKPRRGRIRRQADAGTPARPGRPLSPASGNRRGSGCASARASVASLQHQLRGSFRMLPPQVLDPVVRILPFRNRGSPVAEDGLRPAPACAASSGMDRISRTSLRQRIGDGAGRARDRQPEASRGCCSGCRRCSSRRASGSGRR